MRHTSLAAVTVLGVSLWTALIGAVQAPTVSPEFRARAELADAVEQLAAARAQLSVCQGQLASQVYHSNLREVADERARITAAFEAANPGFTIDLKTLAVTKVAEKGGH